MDSMKIADFDPLILLDVGFSKLKLEEKASLIIKLIQKITQKHFSMIPYFIHSFI